MKGLIKMCKVEWCNNKPVWNDYCRNHYNEIRKYGTITNNRPKGKRNEYIIHSDYAEMIIYGDNNTIKARVLIDKEDVNKLKQYSFRYQEGLYVKTFIKNKTRYLHRIIMDYDGELEIDHINRNKLDNRKCNLRIVNRKVNANNITRKDTCYITKIKRNLNKPYCLKIKGKFIGYYKTLDEALLVKRLYL